jgi:hypothetical protein
MSAVAFEPATPAVKWLQIYAVDRMAIGILLISMQRNIILRLRNIIKLSFL